jgi:hypothetical protein
MHAVAGRPAGLDSPPVGGVVRGTLLASRAMVRSQGRLVSALAACAAAAGLALLFPPQGQGAASIGGDEVDVASVADSATLFRAVRRVNRPWTCSRRVNLDLVKVTIRTRREHAIYLRPGCRGYIGRIEVTTRTQDGITVNRGNGRRPAHDLVIGGGYIRCYDNVGGHQDGIQVMDGLRLTFRNLRIKCGRVNERGTNSQFYISGNRPYIPRKVLCIRCILGTGAASPLFIDLSVDSGARRTRVCRGDFGYAVRVERRVAVRPVRERLRILPRRHRLC